MKRTTVDGDRVADLYAGGKSVQIIAKALGIHERTVQKTLTRRGVTLTRGTPKAKDAREQCAIRLPKTVIQFLGAKLVATKKTDPESAYNVGRIVESIITASPEFKNWRKNHVAE